MWKVGPIALGTVAALFIAAGGYWMTGGNYDSGHSYFIVTGSVIVAIGIALGFACWMTVRRHRR